ncbi:MAG: hypothetical protein IJ375_01665 [Oscillospiraceae bacterium]|nr:hypothetical protein [Oscillospiraceae bacterium]
MIDEPNKNAQSKMTDEEFEQFYGELFDEFGPGAEEQKAENVTANAQAAQPRHYQTGHTPYGGNLDAEPIAAAPRQKGIKGLVICACLECLGIVAIVAWWALKIL